MNAKSLLPFHAVAHVAHRAPQPRRKFAILASGWGGASALSMIWAGW